MKKLVAVLLGLSMILSAGCNKDKDGGKESKNSTDASDKADPDDDSGDGESKDGEGSGKSSDNCGKTGSDADVKDPSETDPDATDTTAVPAAAPVEVECKNDLERIPYDEDYTFGGTFYPKEITEDDWESDPEGDYRWIKVDGASLEWNTVTIEDPKYDKLQAAIDELQNARLEERRAEYDEMCEELKKRDPADYNGINEIYNVGITVYRADSKVFCLSFDYGTAINIDSQTGKIITLSDVVKDKAAFEELLTRYAFELRYTGMDDNTVYDKDLADIRHEQIEKETLEFILDYDGMTIFMDDNGMMLYTEGEIKISAMTNPEIFNMEYFGHAPQYYTLRPNQNGMFYWDFDEDGKLDYLGTEKTWDDSWNFGFSDLIAGQYLGPEVPYAESTVYTEFNYLQADDGKYIYIYGRVASLGSDLKLKAIPDADLGNCIGFYSMVEDPAGYLQYDMIDLLGYRDMERHCTILGGNGAPTTDPLYYSQETDEQLKSLVDIKGVTIDIETRQTGEEVTVPKGSLYDIIEYDDETKMVLFRITPPGAAEKREAAAAASDNSVDADTSEDYYVQMEFLRYMDQDSDDWKRGGTLSGIDQYDAFGENKLPRYGQ
ncbi:MAG: hypothetical protein IK125_00975 [Lachnospiraceae bacterium]|nr:hypothetical protein [Lachnospiraceae bacterium]